MHKTTSRSKPTIDNPNAQIRKARQIRKPNRAGKGEQVLIIDRDGNSGVYSDGQRLQRRTENATSANPSVLFLSVLCRM